MSDNPWAPEAVIGADVSDLTVRRNSLGGTAATTRPAATIQFEDGTIETIDGFTLIGRDPVPEPDVRAQLLKVADPEKGVSKSHLAVDFVDGGLSARDLGSTNQTAVVRDGTQLPVPPGVWTPLRTGDLLVLGGTRRFTITDAPVAGPPNDVTVARSKATASPVAPAKTLAQAPAAPSSPAPNPVTPAAPGAPRCRVCGDVLDPSARFCVVCGTPIEGGAAPAGRLPPQAVAPAGVVVGVGTPVWKRPPVLIAAGAVIVVAAVAGFLLLQGGGDGSGGSSAAPARVPSTEPSPRDFADAGGDGELYSVRGTPDLPYALRVDGDEAEVVAFDGAGNERWTGPVSGTPGSMHLVGGRIIVSGSDDDGDPLLAAFDEDGKELWSETPRADSVLFHEGRVYTTESDTDTGMTDSITLVDVSTGQTGQSVRGDMVVETPNAILTWDEDDRVVSAYSLDVDPLIEKVRIDDEDQWPLAYHDGVIVTIEDDEIFGYDTNGEVWSTRVQVGDIGDAYPLAGDRWLLTSFEEGSVSVESGIGRGNTATTVWEVDGDSGIPANGGIVVVSEFDDEGDSETRLYDADGSDLGTALDNAELIDTANHLLFWTTDDDGDAQYVAYSTDGEELWAGQSTEHSLRLLDGGYAIVETEFDTNGEPEYTIDVFG